MLIKIKVGRIVFLLFVGGVFLFFLEGRKDHLPPAGDLMVQEFFSSENFRLEEFSLPKDRNWKQYRDIIRGLAGPFLFFPKQPEDREKKTLKESMEQPVLEPALDGSVLADFYRQEISECEKLTRDAVKRWEEHLQQEMAEKIRQKEKRLQYNMQAAIAEKEQACAEELADFRRKTEDRYLVSLADLRFKMYLPGLSAAERERLDQEIRAEEKRMTEEINIKAGELEAELAAFAKQEKAAAAEKLENYRRQLLAEKEARLEKEKEKLVRDYRQWRATGLDKGG